MDTDFLDWALADFSGDVAADERYDGPFSFFLRSILAATSASFTKSWITILTTRTSGRFSGV